MMRAFTRFCGLATAVAMCLVASGCTSAEAPTQYEIAGGSSSGVYFSFAEQLAQAEHRALGSDFEAIETQGSIENLERVGTGEALLGFAQGDAAVDAVRGEGNFDEALPIRAVARVYDEYVHVVVAADSDIHELADLSHRSVSLGATDSGVQVIAQRVLEAAGVDQAHLENRALGLDQSLEAMQHGDIEAFFWVGGVPTPGIEELRQEMPLRLLPIAPEVVDRVNEGHSGVYRLTDFPVGFYELDGATATMAVPNYLITAADAPDALIADVLRVLFESRVEISRSVPAAGYLDRRQAIFTDPIELHPGAATYYVQSRR
ncbi:MAG: TAXI family TRAP transporter solute-binding subunit [Leucobacter sp.]